MRTALAILLAAGLAFIARADDPKPATAQPTTPPAAEPAPAPAPAGKPVPNGEVVKKTELADGLIAEDLKIGEGAEVKTGWTVTAFYHGTLKSDGKVFDSAYDRGQPATFPLNGVIQGWAKGVPGMKIGGIRRLTIPAALAYGANPPTPAIPANSDLVFVIEVTDAFGIDIQDVTTGTGEETAGQQCVAVTNYVIKGEDGKEIENKKMYIWFPGENQGMTTAFDGMKVGGKRIVKIPGQLNINAPQLESTRVQNVPITVEFELVAFRNIPGQRR